jgi:hypothetical protein
MEMDVLSRRSFAAGGLASIAFAGVARRAMAQPNGSSAAEATGYGSLVPDPQALIDLPQGFTYRVISKAGEAMDDGFFTPDNFDGMGCFPLGGSRVALVRNHELEPGEQRLGPTGGDSKLESRLRKKPHFGVGDDGKVLPGGTTTLVYDVSSGRLERQYLSLAGTALNCAGGATLRGSWLSCEEVSEDRPAGKVGASHGWVFDVSARQRGLKKPRRLTGLGRFRHEAAVADPRTGIVYLTEDQDDGLFYRFLPDDPRRLGAGGRLQAMGLRDAPQGSDTRNWGSQAIAPGSWKQVVWIDLDGVDNPHGDLRMRGRRAGAAIFARGEGIHHGTGEIYFTCTSGGAGKIGQIMRYVPSTHEGKSGERDEPGRLQLFLESSDPARLNYVDNITIAPWGHLIACEDRRDSTDTNYLRGITTEGRVYDIARCRVQTELAGACFSPDKSTLFLNIYAPGRTLAITGPWSAVKVV